MDWSKNVVLITGASSGIGRALALELAQRGARLGLIARRSEVLGEIVREIDARKSRNGDGNRTVGPTTFAVSADVQDAASMKSAVERVRSELGPVNLLIANAGIGATTDAASLDPEEVARVITTNVIGAANSVAAVLPGMLERGSGHLVVISSLAAYRGLPKSAAYCASKAAVSAFFESLRLDLEPRGINVTIIHPGFIKTPLTAGRSARMPYLMELDDAIQRIVTVIEKRKKSYAFPWQLASIVRAGMIMPNFMYDWISRRNSFRE